MFGSLFFPSIGIVCDFLRIYSNHEEMMTWLPLQLLMLPNHIGYVLKAIPLTALYAFWMTMCFYMTHSCMTLPRAFLNTVEARYSLSCRDMPFFLTVFEPFYAEDNSLNPEWTGCAIVLVMTGLAIAVQHWYFPAGIMQSGSDKRTWFGVFLEIVIGFVSFAAFVYYKPDDHKFSV